MTTLRTPTNPEASLGCNALGCDGNLNPGGRGHHTELRSWDAGRGLPLVFCRSCYSRTVFPSKTKCWTDLEVIQTHDGLIPVGKLQ